MPSADGSARCHAPGVVALTPDAGLPGTRYTFDQDDRTSGKIGDSSGSGLTATLVNGSTARSVAGTDGGTALAFPAGHPPTTARTSYCAAKSWAHRQDDRRGQGPARRFGHDRRLRRRVLPPGPTVQVGSNACRNSIVSPTGTSG